MFNGIIYNQGTISKIIKRPKGINIFVRSNFKLRNWCGLFNVSRSLY